MITVSLIEDDREVRESLSVLINGTPGFRCRSVYPNAETALIRIPNEKPQVVLMDIGLLGLSGMECETARHPDHHAYRGRGHGPNL